MAVYDQASLQARLDRVQFTRWLAPEVIEVSVDHVSFQIRPRLEMTGSPATGAMHGGVIAALIDIAASLAIIAQTGGDYVTVNLSTDFHKMAKSERLIIVGRIINRGGTLTTTEARIENTEGQLIASGRAVMLSISSRLEKQKSATGTAL
jgi:uncharacterized protein (TIGR00369 family)